ncbi:MAG: hypothetical protein PHS47_03385 [Methanocellales archaeon]|nr:hypothetical protein [Methanocellales archaeon]MDD3421325.1 hypothetical protein [Methanocellales archaeon]MDD4898615.1 hypothetical protein [Methanocellales archaeon]MDD5447394.1 hypothetical protein [Methanocellales archaeon]
MAHLINHLIATVLTLSPWQYLINIAIAVTGRTLDLLSTWYLTPTLEWELNPIAKRAGWKRWISLNLVLCAMFAFWLNPSIMLFVMGILAASHNLNQFWLAHMARHSKEWKTYGELVEKVNPRIAYISRIPYEIAIGVIGLIIICLVGLDISKTMSWIGFALVSHAFAVIFYLRLNQKR